jgi:predicted Zn-dependent peptidase
VVSAQVNFRAGEFLLQDDKWESAHLLEHLVLCANNEFPKARDFQSAIERHGAYSNASTGLYNVTYEIEASQYDATRVLKLLMNAISKPAFLEEEFRTELDIVAEELVMRSNDHFRELNSTIKKAMGLRMLSDKERLYKLPNIRNQDVIDHHKATHGPQNASFIIAGAIRPIKKELQNILELSWPKSATAKHRELPDELPCAVSNPIVITKKEVPNVYVYVDLYADAFLTFKEQLAIRMLSIILTETLYSRVFGVARERGIIYGINSGLMNTGSVSGMWFGAQVSKKNLLAVMRLLSDELLRVKQGVLDDQDVELAKDYLLGRTARVYQTAESIVDAYSHYFIYGKYFRFDKKLADIEAMDAVYICKTFRKVCSAGIGAGGFLGNINDELAQKANSLLSPIWDAATDVVR